MTASAQAVKLTREQLYELVWSRPLTTLAKEYDLSDVGFAKLCKSLNVPRPSVGYWARKAAGYSLKQTPLPPPKVGSASDATLRLRQSPPSAEIATTPEAAELARRLLLEQDPDQKITVDAELVRPHRLVRLSRPLLRKAKTFSRDVLIAQECLDVHVSPGSLDRALRIMDALLKALEVRGVSVELTPPKAADYAYARRASTTVVRVGQDRVCLSMTESRKVVPREAPPPEADRRRPRHLANEPLNPTQEYQYTGSLTLVVGNGLSPRRIRDGRTSRLEDRLNEVVCELLRKVDNERLLRLRKEVEERQRQEEQKRREEEERRRRIESVWVHDLLDRRKDWSMAQEIRAFADAVESRRPSEPTEEWPCDAWLAWARRHADRLESKAFARLAQQVRLPPDHDRWPWELRNEPIQLPVW